MKWKYCAKIKWEMKRKRRKFTASICREFGSKFFLFKLETKWLICVKVNDKASWFIVSHLKRHWESSNTTRCRWSSHLRIEFRISGEGTGSGQQQRSQWRRGCGMMCVCFWGRDDDLIWFDLIWFRLVFCFCCCWRGWPILSLFSISIIHCGTGIYYQFTLHTPQWFTARECHTNTHSATLSIVRACTHAHAAAKRANTLHTLLPFDLLFSVVVFVFRLSFAQRLTLSFDTRTHTHTTSAHWNNALSFLLSSAFLYTNGKFKKSTKNKIQNGKIN